MRTVKIGIIGYQGSGKSTLFHWLTGERPDPVVQSGRVSGLVERETI